MNRRNWQIVYSDYTGPEKKAIELVNKEGVDIFVATRKFTEIARPASSSDKTSEGYEFIDTGDLHYSQIGYNYHGNEAATNFFGVVYGGPDYKATDVETYDGTTVQISTDYKKKVT